MPKFRKKPVEIEAWLISDVMWAAKQGTLDSFLKDAQDNSVISFADGCIYIQTLEGKMRGSPDAYLIRGVQGELYACDPGIFKKTYDPVSNWVEPSSRNSNYIDDGKGAGASHVS